MRLKRVFCFVRDIIEIYIPVLTFSVMFIVFLLQIFYRYILNHPLTWPYELTLFTFIWTVILGAIFARRMNGHVSFSMLYDSLSEKKKIMSRIIGNIIIVCGLCITLYPSYDYIQFMSFQKSTVLRIPFNVAFSPFLIFLILIICYSLIDIITDIKRYINYSEANVEITNEIILDKEDV
jgi:TRAP-type C4-dicarboxylate transport system permease small subunit